MMAVDPGTMVEIGSFMLVVFSIVFAGGKFYQKHNADIAAIRQSKDLITTSDITKMIAEAVANQDRIYMTHPDHNAICKANTKEIYDRLDAVHDSSNEQRTKILVEIQSIKSYLKGYQNGKKNQ